MSNRLAKTLNEPILPDDYPIYGDYLYVADGEVIRSEYHNVSARELKQWMGVTELRRCDITGRAEAIAAHSGSEP